MNDQNKKNIRAFIAFELSSIVKRDFENIIGELKKSGADVKWVEPRNAHITLKFLGSVPVENISKINSVLKKIADSTKEFKVVLNGVGVFPKWEKIKIIWVGVENGSEELKNIAIKMERAMSELGFSKETKTFSLHITIGRVRSLKNKNKLKDIAVSLTRPPLEIKFFEIILFESTLFSNGPVYTVIERFPLAAEK
ncbi:2',5' RNA ligase [Candidatus Omnitrophus magneticus]|uniref:RNA 2',3'-cyclic phosphodiesterase n=1 Tax=Candidatus Omnitrophus magneticus TaxID=1609969 RepID=A0A0F0CR10_9BACT|nr:2',5' RNA ligase [Candidatus Omnitrophus magneticus]